MLSSYIAVYVFHPKPALFSTNLPIHLAHIANPFKETGGKICGDLGNIWMRYDEFSKIHPRIAPK